MTDKKMFFTVGADVAPGSKGFDKLSRDAKKSMGEVDDAIEDSRSNAQRVADALGGIFDQVDAELDQTKLAADALATALGPELSAKVDTLDAIAKFERLGLTLDEIRAEADTLADSIRKADATSMKGVSLEASHGRDRMRELGQASDQSRSVLANMVGNSTQDLGELGGVAGSAGVMIGQLGEYAVDGNIKLRNLAMVAGPMALVTVAAAGITAGMEAMAKVKAFETERVDAYVESLQRGEDQVKALADRLKEAGEVKFAEEGLFGNDWFGRVSDAKYAIANAGLSFDEFSEIVNEGEEAIAAWGEKALAEGKNAEDVNVTLDAMNQELRAQRDAANEAAGMNQLNERSIKSVDEAMQAWLKNSDPVKGMPEDFKAVADGLKGVEQNGVATKEATDALNRIMRETGLSMDEVFEAASKLNPEIDTAAVRSKVLADQQTQAAEAADRMRDAALEQAQALKDQSDAMQGAAEASIAATDASDDFIDAVEESTRVQDDAEASADDVRDAIKAERDALRDTADAAVRLKDEQAKANGVTLTAKDRIDTYNQTLMSNAKYATPAAQQAAYDYLIELNGIPEAKATEIRADVAAGRLAEADRKINEASRNRDLAIRADAQTADAQREIDNIRGRTVQVRVDLTKGSGVAWSVPGGQFRIYDSGTTSAPEDGWAGERRPEFVNGGLVTGPTPVGRGTEVVGGMDTRRLLERLAAGGGAGMPAQVNVALTVNAGVISNRMDLQRIVLDAFEGAVKRDGPRRVLKLLNAG